MKMMLPKYIIENAENYVILLKCEMQKGFGLVKSFLLMNFNMNAIYMSGGVCLEEYLLLKKF
jgi:hypothetical protein